MRTFVQLYAFLLSHSSSIEESEDGTAVILEVSNRCLALWYREMIDMLVTQPWTVVLSLERGAMGSLPILGQPLWVYILRGTG